MNTFHIIIKSQNSIAAFGGYNHKIFFLQLLNATIIKYKGSLHAFVIMDTHVHLLVTVPNTSLLIKTLLSRYARIYNKLNNRQGPVFQNGAIIYQKQYNSWKIDTILYILNNPLEARMCRCHKDYHFSSYKLHTGQKTSLANIIVIDNSLIEENFRDMKQFKEALKDKLKYQKSVAHIKYNRSNYHN